LPTRILTWRVWDVLPVNPPLLKQDPPRSVPGLRNGVARHLRSHMEFGNERNWGILLHAEARGEGRSRRISVDTNPQGKSRRYCQTRIRRVGLGAPRVSIGAEVSCRVMNKRDGPVNELVADQKVTIEVPRRRRQSAVATAEPLKWLRAAGCRRSQSVGCAASPHPKARNRHWECALGRTLLLTPLNTLEHLQTPSNTLEHPQTPSSESLTRNSHLKFVRTRK
jgi:hypothetical protein